MNIYWQKNGGNFVVRKKRFIFCETVKRRTEMRISNTKGLFEVFFICYQKCTILPQNTNTSFAHHCANLNVTLPTFNFTQ
jgi:hypothetical protein